MLGLSRRCTLEQSYLVLQIQNGLLLLKTAEWFLRKGSSNLLLGISSKQECKQSQESYCQIAKRWKPPASISEGVVEKR